MITPPIVSFAVEAERTKEVFYVGTDLSVHQLFVTAGGAWAYANVSALARAPRVADNFHSGLLGFAWDANRTKQVFFADNINHVHELSAEAGGGWNHADLSTITPILLQYLGTGYAWELGPSKRLVHPSVVGGVYSAEVPMGGRWTTRNLSLEAGPIAAPLTSPGFGSFVGGASLSGYGWRAGRSQQIAYVGRDLRVHELFAGQDDRTFRYANLSLAAGADRVSVSPSSSLSGYAWEDGRSKQVVYFDNTGSLHELYCGVGSNWQFADLTARTGCPRVNASGRNLTVVGYAWPQGRTKQVVYVGNDRHIYELFCGVESGWSFADLTVRARDVTTGAAGAPNVHPTRDWISAYAWPGGGTKQVVYVGADSNIYELFVGTDDAGWRFANLTRRTSSPVVRA